MPPSDLLNLERLRISLPQRHGRPVMLQPSKMAIKHEERKTTIELWQARWSATSKATWTRFSIPDVSVATATRIRSAIGTLFECPYWGSHTDELGARASLNYRTILCAIIRGSPRRPCWESRGLEVTQKKRSICCTNWSSPSWHLKKRKEELGKRLRKGDRDITPDAPCGWPVRIFLLGTYNMFL